MRSHTSGQDQVPVAGQLTLPAPRVSCSECVACAVKGVGAGQTPDRPRRDCIDDESRIIYSAYAALAISAEQVASAGSPGALVLAGEHLAGREQDVSFVAMLPSPHSPSPEVVALRVATEAICKQLRYQAREQARLIRSGAAGDLTEANVERMATDIAAAAHAQLDAAAPHCQSPSADPELQATRREAAHLVAAAARQVDAELRKARRARDEKVAGRRWRR